MKTVTLGSVCNLVNGKAFTPTDWSTVGTPIVRIQNLKDSDNPFNYFAGSLENQVPIKTGDLLLAWSGTPGTSFGAHIWRGGDAILNQHIFRCDIDRTVITAAWAKFVINTQLSHLIDRAHGGVGLKHVTRGVVESLNIPLPNLMEQRRIAEILDRAEALRTKRRITLAQVETLARSIFLELFGDPRSNEKNWPTCRIGSVLSDFRGGANLAPDDFVESGFPILHKGAIKPNGEVALDEKKKTFATPEYATTNRRCQVDRKYLAVTLRDLVPIGPSIGLVANLQDGPFDAYLLAQGAYGFLVDAGKVTQEYLVSLSNMPSFRHILRKYAVGSTQIHIRTPVYLEIPIPLPPLSVQHEFSVRVAAIKGLRASQLSSLDRLNALFNSLQAPAFIGCL